MRLPACRLRCRRAKSAGAGAVPGGDGGHAGVVPGRWEEAVSSPWHHSPALQPNHLLSCLLLQCDASWRAEPSHCRQAPVCPREHPDTPGPGCQHDQRLFSRSIVPRGSKCLVPLLCRCPALAQTLLCRPWDAGGCCGRRQEPRGQHQAGCEVWAGCPAAHLGSGTSLTSSLGPWLVLCS